MRISWQVQRYARCYATNSDQFSDVHGAPLYDLFPGMRQQAALPQSIRAAGGPASWAALSSEAEKQLEVVLTVFSQRSARLAVLCHGTGREIVLEQLDFPHALQSGGLKSCPRETGVGFRYRKNGTCYLFQVIFSSSFMCRMFYEQLQGMGLLCAAWISETEPLIRTSRGMAVAISNDGMQNDSGAANAVLSNAMADEQAADVLLSAPINLNQSQDERVDTAASVKENVSSATHVRNEDLNDCCPASQRLLLDSEAFPNTGDAMVGHELPGQSCTISKHGTDAEHAPMKNDRSAHLNGNSNLEERSCIQLDDCNEQRQSAPDQPNFKIQTSIGTTMNSNEQLHGATDPPLQLKQSYLESSLRTKIDEIVHPATEAQSLRTLLPDARNVQTAVACLSDKDPELKLNTAGMTACSAIACTLPTASHTVVFDDRADTLQDNFVQKKTAQETDLNDLCRMSVAQPPDIPSDEALESLTGKFHDLHSVDAMTVHRPAQSGSKRRRLGVTAQSEVSAGAPQRREHHGRAQSVMCSESTDHTLSHPSAVCDISALFETSRTLKTCTAQMPANEQERIVNASAVLQDASTDAESQDWFVEAASTSF